MLSSGPPAAWASAPSQAGGSLLRYLEPAVSVAGAVILLGEHLTVTMIGGLLILAGVTTARPALPAASVAVTAAGAPGSTDRAWSPRDTARAMATLGGSRFIQVRTSQVRPPMSSHTASS